MKPDESSSPSLFTLCSQFGAIRRNYYDSFMTGAGLRQRRRTRAKDHFRLPTMRELCVLTDWILDASSTTFTREKAEAFPIWKARAFAQRARSIPSSGLTRSSKIRPHRGDHVFACAVPRRESLQHPRPGIRFPILPAGSETTAWVQWLRCLPRNFAAHGRRAARHFVRPVRRSKS